MADFNAAFPGGGGAGGRETLVTVRDRLFHTLFFRISLGYARACNATARRLIETLILLKVMTMLHSKSAIFLHIRMIHCCMEFHNNMQVQTSINLP